MNMEQFLSAKRDGMMDGVRAAAEHEVAALRARRDAIAADLRAEADL